MNAQTGTYDGKDLAQGTKLFRQRLEEMISENPELSNIHQAFEQYCANKYSLGNSASNQRVGGSNDLGIDFYSQYDHAYHIGQCKIPADDWLEAHPDEIKHIGAAALDDARDALRYLTGGSTLKPNERVRELYALIQADRVTEGFSLTFFVVVYGQLNKRARESFDELEREYHGKGVAIVLQEMPNLVDEFLVGASHPKGEIKIDLRVEKTQLLRAKDYCYFLANAADLYSAFSKYGWRLFDLNLRYEVRNSAINGEIVRSLKHQKSRRQFHHFNNGIIVVAKQHSFHDQDSRVRLVEAQIVNGLQTVKSIYNAVANKETTVDELEQDCVVQIKVITNSEADFVSRVVQCTNNQNPMAARNLKSNNREQKVLRKGFSLLAPRWFYQLKEGEWKSLTGESGRFFEQVVGFKPSEFRPDPARQNGRVIDNQDAAKAWLAFIGFADESADRVTHYFAEDAVYNLAFHSRPSAEYWKQFASSVDWHHSRLTLIERYQGDAIQYLLAFFLWQFVNAYIPSPQKYREQSLNEGVRSGKITKSDGSFTSSQREQDAFLAENRNYQTWRLMANMKELLVEATSQILTKKYGPLTPETCKQVLHSFEGEVFLRTGDTREIAQRAVSADDFPPDHAISKIIRMLHYVAQQFWEEKRALLLSTSRLRTLLIKREVAADFKKLTLEISQRVGLDKPWKPEGKSFIESLPDLKA
jgi:hypothetical protein